MTLEILKELFSANLLPIQSDIKDLKDGQLQLIEIAKTQARHSEAIENMKKDVDDCTHKVQKIKDNGNNRLWDIVRLGIAGFCGALFGKLF